MTPTSDPEVPVSQFLSGLLLSPTGPPQLPGKLHVVSLGAWASSGLPSSGCAGGTSRTSLNTTSFWAIPLPLPRAHVETITKTLCVHWQTGLSPYGGGSREVGINPISINQKVTDCLVGGSPRQLHQSRAGESHASCGTGIRRSQMDLPVSYTAMQRLHPLDGRCWVTGS